jgi:hypothetical protein
MKEMPQTNKSVTRLKTMRDNKKGKKISRQGQGMEEG